MDIRFTDETTSEHVYAATATQLLVGLPETDPSFLC